MAILIVCAPATARLEVTGTSYAFSCSRCQRRVQMAPSGQRFARANEVLIICLDCLEAEDIADCPPALTASPEEIAREIRSTQPNTWRNRN